MKILYLTSKNYPGVSKYGKEGEDVGLWKLKYIEDIENFTEILEDVDRMIISPYGILSESKIVQLKMAYLSIKIGYLWHSSAGEVELAKEVEINELANLTKMHEDKTIDFLFFTTESLAKIFDGTYLPHPLKPAEPIEIKKENIISLFCPPTLKKGIFPQILAVKLFQKNHPEYILHTNLEAYKPVMDWLNLNYKLHPWLEKDEFYEILSKSKFALQCSFSESFNYFVSDCLMRNTPVITSKEINWNPIKNLIVERIDPIQINDKMEYITGLPADTEFADIKIWKERINQKNQRIKEILDKLIKTN